MKINFFCLLIKIQIDRGQVSWNSTIVPDLHNLNTVNSNRTIVPDLHNLNTVNSNTELELAVFAHLGLTSLWFDSVI